MNTSENKCVIEGKLRAVGDYTNIVRSHYDKLKKASSSVKTINDIPAEFGFQPELDCDFPTGGGKPRIPPIVHQVWLSSPDEGSVPTKFVDNVKSFMKHNPNWTYFFWNNKTVRALLNDRHPKLLPIYDSFNEIVVKGDMVRYILLYEFGGLYADFDTVCHRPLDKVTTKYPCMLVPEPFEHAVLWYGSPFVIINAIMLCRPKHPFFKQIVDSLPSRQNVSGIVHKLGPGYLTNQYKLYIGNTQDPSRIDTDQETTSPYFYKGSIPDDDDNGIYVPNTRFFMDNPSPALQSTSDSKCKNNPMKKDLAGRMCKIVQTRGYKRPPGTFTFLEHQWTHTWSNQKKNNKYDFTYARNMTPHFRSYSLN